MITYFINNIFIFLLMFINRKKFLLLWVFISVSLIIFFLPTTGDDYNFYKADYDSSFFDYSFPYFHSSYALDAEPFWKFYTSFIKVSTSIPFNGFLVFNFVFCSLLLFLILKKIFNISSIVIFYLFSLLTIVPTIYYFSPRSSISFIFALYAFIYYIENKTLKGILFSFISIGFHSQFIPLLFIFLIGDIYNKFVLKKKRKKRKYIIFIFIFIFILLLLLFKFPLLIYSVVSTLISSLPSGTLIEAKLHYFETARQGMRITSLLSIIVFPVLFLIAIKYKYFTKIFHKNISSHIKNNFIFFFGLSLFFGMIVNMIFLNNSHVASRISRFSDYISLLILLPTIFLSIKNRYMILPIFLIFLSIAVIYIYPTLYNFKLTIF